MINLVRILFDSTVGGDADRVKKATDKYKVKFTITQSLVGSTTLTYSWTAQYDVYTEGRTQSKNTAAQNLIISEPKGGSTDLVQLAARLRETIDTVVVAADAEDTREAPIRVSREDDSTGCCFC